MFNGLYLIWRNTVKNIKQKYPMYLMLFIILQPVLDLLTFSFMNLTDISITPSIVIRMLVLGLSVLYLYTRRDKYLSKKFTYYIVAYSAFIGVHFLVNLFQKNSFNFISEVTSIAKNSYFLLFFLIFIVAFKEIKEKKLTNFFPINISFAMFIVNIVMLLATLTGTGKRSYGALYKIGHSGWFYAANDIGVILAISLPILIWITFRRQTKKWMVFNWLNILLTMVSLFTVGTKVGHLAVVITLIIASISYIYEISIKKQKHKMNKINLTLSIVLMALTLLTTPYLPAYRNSTGQINSLIEQGLDEEEPSDASTELPNTEEEDFFGEGSNTSPELVDGVIYSGRSGFLTLHEENFQEAPLTQKIFGMGYAGNYIDSPKVIERDFHDIFYQFGILGFSLYMLPFIYYGISILIQIFRNLYNLLGIKNTMLCTSILLGLGIGFMAGHTLTSPAVSIYLALIMAYKSVEAKFDKVELE